MKTKQQYSRIHAELQQEQGKVCISIILPTHRLSPERRTDELRFERAMEKVRDQLMTNYDKEETGSLLEKVEHLYSQVDFNHNHEGLGLFVSQNVERLVQFPFQVKEKVGVANSFYLRDVLLLERYSTLYYVVHITRKNAWLFRAEADVFTEVIDQNFPFNYVDDYEYSRPVRGTSYVGYAPQKGFEKDKSFLETDRFKAFLHDLDGILDDYLKDDIPLVVCGVIKDEAYFLNYTAHIGNIAGVITGNYDYKSEQELEELVWPTLKSSIDQNIQKEIDEFEESFGEGLGESGIQDVWWAVQEGRGVKLLVEKDFSLRGYVEKDDYRLLLSPSPHAHMVVPDAVEDLVAQVLRKGGQVVVVDNNALQAFDRIGLITQY